MKTRFLFLTLLISTFLNILPAYTQSDLRIFGKVLDSHGNPLPGASVSVLNNLSGTFTGADGRFSVPLNKPGLYKIRFSFTGYEEVVKDLTVTGPSELEVSLAEKTILAGEVIVEATRASASSPVAFTSVTAKEIKKLNFGQDLPFVISNTPSLVETSESGTGIGYTSFRIRGTDGSRINVTVDGVPLNDAESQQVFWVDLPDLASSVENIQIQRGVGTSSNGAGAFGASVNLLTQSPSVEPFGEFSASYGSFNSLKYNVSAGTGTIADRFAMQIRYSGIKSDGYIRRTGVDNSSGSLSAVWRSEKSFLKANILAGEEHVGISWWGVPAEVLSADRRYNPAGEYRDSDGTVKYYNNETDNYVQNHFRLGWGYEPVQNLTVNAALHYTMGKGYYEEYREDQPFGKYGLPDLIIGGTTITGTDLIRRKWMSNDFYGAVWSLSYKYDKISLVAGGGANIYTGDHFGRIIWMQNSGQTPKDHEWYLNNSRKGEISIYGRFNYRISQMVNSFADLQYRRIEYTMKGPDDDFKDLTASHEFDFFNPKAGLTLKISDRSDAFISFSIANREPTRADFKEAAGDPAATPRHETLYDTESGYSFRGSWLSASVILFNMYYHDQLVPTGELSDVGYPIMTNVKKSYRRGIEIVTGMKPVSWFNWDLNLSLSSNRIPGFVLWYTDYNTSDWSEQYLSKDLGTVDIAYSPSVIAGSSIDFTLPHNFTVHLLSKYVGKQYFDNTSDEDRKIDPYFVTNLVAQYSPSVKKLKALDFRLVINNIFSAVYESNGYGGLWYEDGNEKTWSYYFPQAGINVLGSLSVRF